jgi:glutamate-1-semialdehyde 2,1-aminomutase
MIDHGIYLPCSQFEANFVSVTHTPELIDATLAAARDVLAEVAAQAE